MKYLVIITVRIFNPKHRSIPCTCSILAVEYIIKFNPTTLFLVTSFVGGGGGGGGGNGIYIACTWRAGYYRYYPAGSLQATSSLLESSHNRSYNSGLVAAVLASTFCMTLHGTTKKMPCLQTIAAGIQRALQLLPLWFIINISCGIEY